ncbi:hypothetical protein [Aestuariibius sp. HNIBRBA575]|uniref:hypothetical protein n=1 Tax=Aestuariibius sp. HNIBRBA575 TaxID=3233343 RepID=UPI0034A55A42
MKTAEEIYQSVLDGTRTPLLEGNFQAFRRFIALPHSISTRMGTVTMHTEKHLESTFQTFHTSLKDQRVTDYIRTTIWAKFVNDTLIQGAHSCLMISGSTEVAPAYGNEMSLEFDGETWRVASSVSSVANIQWPTIAPVSPR